MQRKEDSKENYNPCVEIWFKEKDFSLRNSLTSNETKELLSHAGTLAHTISYGRTES